MKHATRKLAGIFLVNVFLALLWGTNPALYQAFIDSGAQWASCVDWDANGHVIPGVCEGPAPTPPQAAKTAQPHARVK